MQSQIKSARQPRKLDAESKARVGFCNESESVHSIDKNINQKVNEPKLSCSIEFHKDRQQQVSMKEHRSRPDMISGISFSRFQEIPEDSESEQPQVQKYSLKQVPIISMRKTSMSKIPTSNKVISSNKLIEEPIQQVKQFDQHEHNLLKESSEGEFNFSYAFLVGHQLFQKFAQYSKSKQMQLKMQNHQIIAIKKVPLYKTALRLCFPQSDELEHEIYQLTCPVNQTAKIKHLSGSLPKFRNFVENFALSLWIDKYLVTGSMQENLKYFIKYVNTFPNQLSVAKVKKGQINELKQRIQTAIKNIADKNNIKPALGELKLEKKQSAQDKQYSINSTVQLIVVQQKMKQMEQKLKGLLEKQLKKQEILKAKRIIQEKLKNGSSIDQENIKNNNEEKKIYVPPSVQRMLMNAFYRALEMHELVEKYLVKPKSVFDFEQKKMILKGSLSVEQIFKYLELQQFYKLCTRADLTKSQQIKKVLPQSIKILSSLRHKTYPCPAHALELISIFRSTLKKQIDSFSKSSNNSVVKLQDYSNEQRTLLQFCIYCLVMCENEDIYVMIDTVHLFSRGFVDTQGKLQLYNEDSIKMLKTLKKAIHFIQNEWQL